MDAPKTQGGLSKKKKKKSINEKEQREKAWELSKI